MSKEIYTHIGFLFYYLQVSVGETQRCNFTGILSVSLSICLSLCLSMLYRLQFFTDPNDTVHKNSILDREEPHCLTISCMQT